ncbi:hypothetical protein D018_3839 [Vibrio parahaemolyticus VP2007-007]|nr:hypothetical protein D018_3839 [Vibrio parahaemolyticus VP2007-007]
MVVLTINSNLLPFNPTQKAGFKQKQFFTFGQKLTNSI